VLKLLWVSCWAGCLISIRVDIVHRRCSVS